MQAMKVLDGGRISHRRPRPRDGAGRLRVRPRATRSSASSSARPIAEFQSIQYYLADMATEIDAARLLTCRAGWMKDRGHEDDEGIGDGEALRLRGLACAVANLAVQIHGGYGFTKDFPAEKFYRDVKLCTIGEGTTEIQRMVIARQLLRPGR